MRTNENGRVPVPAQWNIIRSRLRLDAHALAGAAVIACEVPVLILGIDRVWIFGIYLRAEAITTLRDEPISIRDAGNILGARWTTDGIVVLRAAVDIIERGRVVDRHIV